MKPTIAMIVWTAIRPKTLPLAATPVLVGLALAWAEGATPQILAALATLAAALLIQIGANLHNDAADHERGNDRADRVGPLRVTAAGWATAAQVKTGARLVFATAFALGVYLASIGGWPIVAIGLASLAAGAAYSGGPQPISHTPFGEIFVWIFFGVLAVVGAHWLQAGHTSLAAWAAGAALGLPAAAVLLVNNLRDVAADTAVGRRTLAAVLGDDKARRIYALFMLLPFAALPLLAKTGLSAWLAVLAFPVAVKLARRMRTLQGPAMNELLAATARQQLLFGLLLAIGLLLS